MPSETTFGRYVIERRIAVGGMAELFVGRLDGPRGFSKRVVVKKILWYRLDTPHVRQMFADEARIAARFAHTNVVQVFELVEDDGQLGIVMEHLEGNALDKVFDRSHKHNRLLPLPVIAHLISETALGLHYVHTLADESGRPLDIVHRDISPKNIIVTAGGRVKVVDFGIAKHHQSTQQTAHGVVKGTLNYMSPEQIRGQRVDVRSDVFSLGTVLYEALTGKPCFPGGDAKQLSAKIAHADYTPLEQARPQTPVAWRELVDSMLHRDPSQRPQGANTVARQLLGVTENEPVVMPRDVATVVGALFEARERTQVVAHAATSTGDAIAVPPTLSSPTRKLTAKDYEEIVARQALASSPNEGDG